LSDKLDKYYTRKKKHPFHEPNLRWINNGLQREMARVLSQERGRIRAALSEDIVYKKSAKILLDENSYYDILSPTNLTLQETEAVDR
ncbi:MAG: hypothetical protein GXO91_04630, partial [FCB group bacterium]|nr:hypothetical protein [FCB group bacterium]